MKLLTTFPLQGILKPALVIVALVALSGTAVAGGHRDYYDRDYDNHHYRGSHTDYARVISVKPIYETRRSYHSDYRYDDYDYDHDYHKHGSSKKPLIGAIIGGGLGHALGNHKKSKRVGAAVGAVLGAAIASDSGKKHRRHHRGGYYDHYEEIVGYKVKYRYNGRVYKTRTNYDPGRRIKVKVDVRPAHRY